jgi:hypothetical protein
MGIYEGRGQLAKASKELTARWNDARLSWNDARAKEFEEQFLAPLEVDLRKAADALDRVAAMVSQIRRECQ